MSGIISNQIKAVELAEQKLKIKKASLIEKAISSENPDDILSGVNAFNKIMPKSDTTPKAFFIDPLEFNSNLGFKDKPYSLSYTTLKRMSKTPVINSIIKTRKNQVADFAEPQSDKYSTGFLVRKKQKLGNDSKMTSADKKIAGSITDFLLNCGQKGSWGNDDFDTFIRKITDDSLTFDQMTFEVIRNRRGNIESFLATDASTFRIADSYYSGEYNNSFFKRNNMWRDENIKEDLIKGYAPSYVQIYQNSKVNVFYPWELCFGTRNPTTSIYSNGYGVSEIEELIQVITAMLWGDEYNRRFFSQGSAPKGLLKFKNGNINETALQQFKQQWQAMITGVMQSWKTPVVEGDVEWVDLQKNNRDMEYTAWMEYLIKIACAVFSIDPTEIGWDISRSGSGGGMFEGSQKERLKNSRDKGLYPLLKFHQRKLNKYIVEQIHPDFELCFMGLNGMTIDQELEMDIKKGGSFMLINELRSKYDLPSLGEEGEILSNSGVYSSVKSQIMQRQQQDELNSQYQQDQNPFDDYGEEKNPFMDEESEEETEKGEVNIFEKAFENFLNQEMI